MMEGTLTLPAAGGWREGLRSSFAAKGDRDTSKGTMLNYVIKRLLGGLIPTLLIVAVLVFLFVHMLHGDPARLIAGPEGRRAGGGDGAPAAGARPAAACPVLALYHQRILQGDFGTSMASRRPVSSEIIAALCRRCG